MGAKESRIGFLSYEEALRRGEGEGSGELRGGQRRAPGGGWPAGREGGREGRRRGGRGGWGVGGLAKDRRPAVGISRAGEVEWGAVFGNWGARGGGEAVFGGGGTGRWLGHSMRSGGVVILSGSRGALSIASWMVRPFLPGPPHPSVPFSHITLSFKKKKEGRKPPTTC